jgi:glycosyltransferase involved in cell wall biosynthesis
LTRRRCAQLGADWSEARTMALSVRLNLKPMDGVRPSDPVGNWWDGVDGFGQFEVLGMEGLGGRWVQLSGTVYGDDEKSVWPKLHFDCGGGFAGFRSKVLPECTRSTPEMDYVFFVPRGLQAARIAVTSSGTHFFLSNICATPLSRFSASMQMLAVVRAADGNVAGARHALRRLLSLVHRPSIFALHDRYREISLGRGYSYSDWIREFEAAPGSFDVIARSCEAWPFTPTISVLMPVYNTAEGLLREAIDSVIAQCYADWELCIADDASSATHVRAQLKSYARADSRIKVVFRTATGGIAAATNAALGLASGEYVALLDHDDVLHPLALHFVSEAVVRNPDARLLYTDEDKLDAEGHRYEPYFKCDFNYELLLAQNMISHLGVYRRDLVSELGGLRSEFDGSQDYDLALRAFETLKPSQIVHIPRVLYHWRATSSSMALSEKSKPYAIAAARAAVSAHLTRVGKLGAVLAAPELSTMNRVRFSVPYPHPKVSIIIPTRDGGNRLRACLDSIVQRTTYWPFEIIVVDNGSRETSTLRFLRDIEGGTIRVIRDDTPFNFSALNNRAVGCASGDFVVLMNDDIEVITPDWVEEMLSFAAQPDVGAVGARLWYPNGLLQHAGVVLGLRSAADHVHRYLPRGMPGYFGRAVLHQSFSAVTAACLMIRTSSYRQVNGLDEALAVSFNDIDFCLRLRETGLRTVWTPYAEMVHHESASRGPDTSDEQLDRVAAELGIMEKRWGTLLLRDPAYSPNLTLDRADFSLACPPRLQHYVDSAKTSFTKATLVDRFDKCAELNGK